MSSGLSTRDEGLTVELAVEQLKMGLHSSHIEKMVDEFYMANLPTKCYRRKRSAGVTRRMVPGQVERDVGGGPVEKARAMLEVGRRRSNAVVPQQDRPELMKERKNTGQKRNSGPRRTGDFREYLADQRRKKSRSKPRPDSQSQSDSLSQSDSPQESQPESQSISQSQSQSDGQGEMPFRDICRLSTSHTTPSPGPQPTGKRLKPQQRKKSPLYNAKALTRQSSGNSDA